MRRRRRLRIIDTPVTAITSALAAAQVPARITEVPATLEEVDGLGERIVSTMLRLWDATDINPLMMVLRSLSGEERTAELMRDFITRNIMRPVAAALDVQDKELRATLAASQFVGLMIVRYVIRLEPLAATSPAVLARIIGPNVQRYLTGDLD